MEKTYQFELGLNREQDDNLTFSKEGWDQFEVDVLSMIRGSMKNAISEGMTPKSITIKSTITIK